MVFNVGPTELIVILIIALIVFGPKRLPEIGRTVGKSLREFRRASQDLKDELNLGLDEDDLPATSPAPGEPGFDRWRTPPAGAAEGSASADSEPGAEAPPAPIQPAAGALPGPQEPDSGPA